jgi:hypothetical protein
LILIRAFSTQGIIILFLPLRWKYKSLSTYMICAVTILIVSQSHLRSLPSHLIRYTWLQSTCNAFLLPFWFPSPAISCPRYSTDAVADWGKGEACSKHWAQLLILWGIEDELLHKGSDENKQLREGWLFSKASSLSWKTKTDDLLSSQLALVPPGIGILDYLLQNPSRFLTLWPALCVTLKLHMFNKAQKAEVQVCIVYCSGLRQSWGKVQNVGH